MRILRFARRIAPFSVVALSLFMLSGCGNETRTARTQETTTMTDQDDRQVDEAAIRAALARYEQALNASDTDAVLSLYAADGVFMPQHFPSAVGATAVRAAYDGVFKAIKLSVKFDIVEVRRVSPNWAFARTNSAGAVTVLADGSSGPEANQELFVFEKSADGDWKIARYCFSTTNPPRR
jgi:uncharacterized protein (TIGR02246 family)